MELAVEAARYSALAGLDDDTRRKLDILRSGINIPAPSDSDKIAEQSEIGAKLGGMYGRGEYCYANGACLDLGHLSDIMAESRDPGCIARSLGGLEKSFSADERPVCTPGRIGKSRRG